ncbi:MAG TPA: hypothetical protein VMX14_09840 [Anaerolineae bacterium]|nr:hypothetical protein [Anaerolineae bacterium]
MGEGIEYVRELKEGLQTGGSSTVTALRVPPDLYEMLKLECHPKTPSEYFEVEVTSDGLLADH